MVFACDASVIKRISSEKNTVYCKKKKQLKTFSYVDKWRFHLKVMMSKLPVCSRAISIARSLASEPLLVRYIT